MLEDVKDFQLSTLECKTFRLIWRFTREFISKVYVHRMKDA